MSYSLIIPYGHTQLFHRHLPECELLVTATEELTGVVTVQLSCCGQEYMLAIAVDENGFPPEEVKKAITVAKSILLKLVLQEKYAVARYSYVH